MESLKVSDYLNKFPAKFTNDMPVAEAVELLLSTHQSGGPVVNKRGMLVGFLSEQDCLVQMLESSYYREQVARVEDIMTDKVMTVKPYHSVLEVTQKLLNEAPKIYPVVDDGGMLLGTINRSNVLYAIDVHLKDGYKNHD